MSSKPKLRVDWCSAEAAKYACQRWHYSRTKPSAGVKIGVWEDAKFVGAILYGVGAGNMTRGEKYGLAKSHEIAELMRVALRNNREHPTSKALAISMRMVAKQSPKLQMLISFADELRQQHIGTIYQATNWVYLGTFEGYGGFIIHGKHWHLRSVGSHGWKQSIDWLRRNVDPKTRKAPTKKHRYAYPLNDRVAATLEKMRQPYPKRAGSADSGTPANQAGGGGANPTSALADIKGGEE